MKSDLPDCATAREIDAQPAIWTAWGGVLAARLPEILERIAAFDADAIWLSGAGTSAYIGDILAAHLDAVLDVPVISAPSTDIVAAPALFARRARRPLVVSFGRSGDSAESVGVLDVLDALMPDAGRFHITCNGDGALARRKPKAGGFQEALVLPEACHDAGFAMTSSFTTMLLSALAVFDPVDDLAARMRALAVEAGPVEAMPVPMRAVFLGSGPLGGAAREAALKVLELTGGAVPVMSETVLGFRHGPKAFTTPDTRIFVFRSSDPHTARYDADLIAELGTQFGADQVTELGPFGPSDIWGAVLAVREAQFHAVRWSAALGLNVDDPFAGQGTLTRVVSGVRLYDPATGQAT